MYLFVVEFSDIGDRHMSSRKDKVINLPETPKAVSEYALVDHLVEMSRKRKEHDFVKKQRELTELNYDQYE